MRLSKSCTGRMELSVYPFHIACPTICYTLHSASHNPRLKLHHWSIVGAKRTHPTSETRSSGFSHSPGSTGLLPEPSQAAGEDRRAKGPAPVRVTFPHTPTPCQCSLSSPPQRIDYAVAANETFVALKSVNAEWMEIWMDRQGY